MKTMGISSVRILLFASASFASPKDMTYLGESRILVRRRRLTHFHRTYSRSRRRAQGSCLARPAVCSRN